MVTLPKEWVYAITRKEEGETQTDMEAKTQIKDKEVDETEEMVQAEKAQPKSKETKKKITKTYQETGKWGPIQAEGRCTRHLQDGKTILEKAENLKRKIKNEKTHVLKSLLLCYLDMMIFKQ
jgi:hypothetical protein